MLSPSSWTVTLLIILLILILPFNTTLSLPLSLSSSTNPKIMTRIALVTGANKGIGYHIALQLAQSGLFTNIIIACRDPNRGLQAQSQIQNQLNNNNNNNNKNDINKCQISYEPLTIGDTTSHDNFCKIIQEKYNDTLHVLVNNAAMAYKNDDPTPFQEQCKPTLDINFYGTVDFTEKMIPFLRKTAAATAVASASAEMDTQDVRIVNVASMAGRIKQIKNINLRNKFLNDKLTKEDLLSLVNDFKNSVLDGTHIEKGWGNSNYGMSKLSLIAMTKVWAWREESHGIKVNCCCPGYCDTDMTSHKGVRDPSDGARNAVIPAMMDLEDCPTGEFFSDYQVGTW